MIVRWLYYQGGHNVGFYCVPVLLKSKSIRCSPAKFHICDVTHGAVHSHT